MMTPRAKTGVATLLKRYLEESLRTEAHPTWRMQAVEEKDIQAKRFIMLTISSYDFRIIVLLHFSSDEASMKYVASRLKISASELVATQYQDFLSEVGNILCGALKRGLLQFFPYLGVSSPNQLDCESLKYVTSYKMDYALHLKATAGDETEFYGSVYISSFGELDFDPNAISNTEEKADVGALELF